MGAAAHRKAPRDESRLPDFYRNFHSEPTTATAAWLDAPHATRRTVERKVVAAYFLSSFDFVGNELFLVFHTNPGVSWFWGVIFQ